MGWRCSFGNCIMRSDGQTHIFHYPVFDKARCHQWLVNARRLDFLNLKVSQLKNRVVCEHHFLDEQFMNFKKNKLTFDAVPCIDGPYCKTSEAKNKIVKETNNSLSIMIDDIENDITIIDRKANYSVKYAEFLTSNDLDGIEIEVPPPPHKNEDSKTDMVPEMVERKPKPYVAPEIVERKPKCYMVPEIVERKDSINSNSAVDSNVNFSNAPTTNMYKKYEAQPVLIIPPYETKPNQSQNDEIYLEIELPPGFINNNTLSRDDKGTILESTLGGIDDKANVRASERNNFDSNVVDKASACHFSTGKKRFKFSMKKELLNHSRYAL